MWLIVHRVPSHLACPRSESVPNHDNQQCSGHSDHCITAPVFSTCLHVVNDTFKTPSSTNRPTEVSWYLLLCSIHLSGVPSLLNNYSLVQLIFVARGERDERVRCGLKVSLFLDDTLSVAIKSVHIDILNGLKGNTWLNISANASLWSRYFTTRMDDRGRV